jgi:hypothetical protein
MFKTMGALAVAVALAAAGAATATAAGGQESTDEGAFLAIVDPGQPSTIEAQFTVPAVDCTSTPGIEDATVQVTALSGLGRSDRTAAAGSSPGAVAVQGLLTARAGVTGNCAGGSASYQAHALGAPLAMTVSPGDQVLLTASFDPATQRRTATVDDLSTGVTHTRAHRDSGQFNPISDFAGIRRAGRVPVPDFGAIHWTGVRINGAPIGSAQSLFGFDLIASIAHPRVLIRTSPLSPAGDAFTNTWIASS